MRRALACASTTSRPSVQLVTRSRPSPPAPRIDSFRPFSSSRSQPFFFRRPTVSPSQIVQELKNAVQDGRPDLVAKLYPSLVETFKDPSSSTSLSSTSSPLITHKELQSIMRTIASKSNRTNLLLKMFVDLTRVFNFNPNGLDHHLVIMGLVNSGKMLKATTWLNSMKETHGLNPHVSDFNLVLQGWRKKKDLYEMRNFLQFVMRDKHDIEPNLVTYNTFISALFESAGGGDKLDQVRKLLQEMELKGIERDLYTETALLTGYLEVGEMASAKQVQIRLKPILTKAIKSRYFDSNSYDTAMVNALLKYEARVVGFDEAVKLAQRYRDGRVPLDSWTLNTLLVEGSKGLQTADEGLELIEQLEDLVDLHADRRAWSAVINELVKSNSREGIEQALQLYQLARDRSIDPDTTMIHPLVQALVLPSPTPDSFETAKSLYEDLSTSSLSQDFSPEQPIYALLLQTCANPSILDLSYSRTLISDMKKRGIKLDSPTAIQLIELLMKASHSFEEAFESYDELRALDPSVFSTTSSYNSILQVFLSLSFPSSSSSQSAPPPLVMEFLSDMRKSSLPADSITYSLLLTYYSQTSSASPSLIEHLHSLIKLDINLDPDLALFNSLMSAYSRVGQYNQVYRIWDTLSINHNNSSSSTSTLKPDQTSLSILLDTCGFDRSREARQRGRRVWNDPVMRKKRNKKNWDTWVECLCRWGRLEEAEKVVFEEMGQEGTPKPDKETFELLIKFARAFGKEEWERVRERVFERRPDLKGVLEDVGAKSLKELEQIKSTE
ncbi:hypothetical protein JCM5350_001264 [Sporobolomyces pararoseus]